MQQKLIVLKVGGSILSPSAEAMFDFDYAYKLIEMVSMLTNEGYKFVITVGGGKVARKYIQLVQDHGEHDEIDIHKVGAAVNNLHAQILHGIFGMLVVPRVIRGDELAQIEKGNVDGIDLISHRVAIVGAGQPGVSSDWYGIKLGQSFDSEKTIVIKNVDGIYTADPKLDSDAELVPELTWQEYLEIIGDPESHVPGANYPIGVEAARMGLSDKSQLYVVGSDIDNIAELIQGGEFVGTIIST